MSTAEIEQQQLIAGKRAAQLFPAGVRALRKPDGIGQVHTKAGMVHFNPKRLKASTIIKAANSGQIQTLLGQHFASGGAVQDDPTATLDDYPDAPWVDQSGEGPASWGAIPVASDSHEPWQEGAPQRALVRTPAVTPTDWGAIPLDEGMASKANPFDRFDPPQGFDLDRTKSSEPTGKPQFDPSKPFEVLEDKSPPPGFVLDDDIGAPSHQDKLSGNSSISSIGLQVPTGFNETLANTAGGPVDAMTWALNHIPGVKIKDPVMGSEFIKRGMGLIGANPDNAPANTSAERIARGAGSGAAAMVAPEAAVGAMGELGFLAPRAIAALKAAFGSSETLPSALGNAAVGATAGLTGSSASEVAPDRFKPLAEMGGNLAGGALGTLGVATTRGVRALGSAAKDYLAPLTDAGQKRLAAETLSKRAASPVALRDALENPPAGSVDGSKATTFQQTGDMGIGSLEREVAGKNPADFMQRGAEQNAARIQGIDALAPTGSPADLATMLKSHRRDVDDMTSRSVDQAQADAHAQIEALDGQRSPEEYGAAMRNALATARQNAKSQERALWTAVDPDNQLALPTTSLKDTAKTIENSLTPSAKPVAGEERDILDLINQYGPVMPFSHITDLRSRVSAAMRDELRNAGETPVYARLARLRGGIENTIANAVEHHTAQETSAVTRGEIDPEQTVAAGLHRQISDWYAKREAETGTDAIANVGGRSSARATVAPGSPRTPEPFRGQSPDSSRDQSLPGDAALQPNFDQAAGERLKGASAATRDRKLTYDTGPVGGALRSAGMQGQYRTMDSGVPAKIFQRGPSGFQSVEAYRKAAGDPQAVGVLGDYAASSLRQAALKPDGTLDPSRFAAWRKVHGEALRALPELSARFDDAATASRAIEDVAAIRREALEHYQRGAFGHLVNANGPDEVTKIIGGLFGQKDSAKAMRILVAETRNDPASQQGLRKAIVEHILKKFISNTEAGASGQGLVKADQFQTFVRDNAPLLGQIFSQEQVNSLRAIAADLQRSNRSITAVKLPGGSNTAQDQAAQQFSLLSKLVHHGRDAAAGAILGFGAAGPIGSALGSVGGAVVTAMRDAGMKRVDDLIRDALLDPNLARKLLAKGSPAAERSHQINLAQYLRRNTAGALFNEKRPDQP